VIHLDGIYKVKEIEKALLLTINIPLLTDLKQINKTKFDE